MGMRTCATEREQSDRFLTAATVRATTPRPFCFSVLFVQLRSFRLRGSLLGGAVTTRKRLNELCLSRKIYVAKQQRCLASYRIHLVFKLFFVFFLEKEQSVCFVTMDKDQLGFLRSNVLTVYQSWKRRSRLNVNIYIHIYTK